MAESSRARRKPSQQQIARQRAEMARLEHINLQNNARVWRGRAPHPLVAANALNPMNAAPGRPHRGRPQRVVADLAAVAQPYIPPMHNLRRQQAMNRFGSVKFWRGVAGQRRWSEGQVAKFYRVYSMHK